MCDEPTIDISLIFLLYTLPPDDRVSWFLSVFLRRSTLSSPPFPLLFVLFFFDEPASARQAGQLPIDWTVDGLSVFAGFHSEHPDSVKLSKAKSTAFLRSRDHFNINTLVPGERGVR